MGIALLDLLYFINVIIIVNNQSVHICFSVFNAETTNTNTHA